MQNAGTFGCVIYEPRTSQVAIMYLLLQETSGYLDVSTLPSRKAQGTYSFIGNYNLTQRKLFE